MGAATAPAKTIALSPCQDPDNGDPVVTAAWIQTEVLDLRQRPGQIRVVVRAVDTGGPGAPVGIAEGSVQIRHVEAARWWTADLRHDSGDRWIGDVRLPRGVRPGEWRLVSVTVRDGLGQSTTLRSTALAEVTADGEARVRSHWQTRPPRLGSVTLRAHRDSETGRRWVRAVVRAHDDVGVESIWFVMRNFVADRESDLVYLRRRAGSVRDGTWAGRLDIPADAPGGRWTADVHILDLTHRDRRALNPVRVPGAVDRTPPALEPLPVSSGPIDVRTTDATLPFEVRATDAGSGVRAVVMSVYAAGWVGEGQHDIEVRARLASGDRHDGRWVADLRLDTCHPWKQPFVFQVKVEVTDRAGRSMDDFVEPEGLSLLLPDRRPPASLLTQAPPEGPVVLRFTEDAFGLTPDALEVVVANVRDWTPVGSPVMGTWSCADEAGSPVDCSTGPVRTATFANPSPVLQKDTLYGVLLNPEHVLSITDAQGNAYDRTMDLFLVRSLR